MAPIFAFIAHKAGIIEDAATELVTAAARLEPGQNATAVLTGWGPDLDVACEHARALYPEVWKIAHEELAYPNAELVRQALVQVLPKNAAVLLAHDHFSVDLAPGLSIKLNAALASDVVGIEGRDATALMLVRQELGGQVNTHVRCDASSGAVITVRPGAFAPATAAATPGRIVDRSSGVGPFTAKRRYVGTIVAEAGDVDITKHHVLVSVGRGIQERDNLGIAEELADAIGGAVSCSRPVVDAKWLDKSRQVGSSGRTVKPKVYLACGISGSFQHLAGLKGTPFIVAINKNPKAPIFRVADVGIVDDVLEFLPALTAKVRDRAGA